MPAKYQIHVFGKSGCDKCKLLNQRIDTLLAQPEWADFEKKYLDLDTVDGLVEFCTAECINPQRVPAFFVARFNEADGRYAPLMNPRAPAAAEDGQPSRRLFLQMGLQTDYSAAGKGVLPAKAIAEILEEARTL